MDHDPVTCDDFRCRRFACKLEAWRRDGMQVPPSVNSTRTPSSTPPRIPNNSWERGEPKDHRGVPYLDRNLEPMTQVEFVQNRHAIEERNRRRHAGGGIRT